MNGVFAVIVVAFIVGLLIGSPGVGGVLLTPALTEIMGMSPHDATGTALASFILPAAYLAWLHARRGNFKWGISIPLALGGLPAGYLGIVLKAHVSGQVIMTVLACMVVIAGLNAMRTPKPGRLNFYAAPALPRHLFLFSLGMVVGMLASLSGAGGPILVIPIMVLCGFPVLLCISAAMIHAMSMCSIATFANHAYGFIDYRLLVWLIAIQLAGNYIGVRVASRLPVEGLRKLVAWVCMLIGFFLMVKELLR